ncbi:MAG: HlyD family efflux transporter periplasmic adaptor subunit [Deltaproteobacteria bacterium]|nr:HlyD family efflux transporter periplasmic adaptor subunit [Deltaproteobacteria bacterium]
MKRFAVIFVVLVAAVAVGLYLQLRSQAREAGRATGGSAIVEGTEVDVVSRLPLRVKEVLVDEGDVVEAGQLVVALDCGEPEAALAQAEAGVAAAKAAASAAEVGVPLASTGIDAAQRQAEAATAQARAAKAQAAPLRVQGSAAERAARRVETLHATGGASEQDVDTAKTQAAALARQLDVAGAGATAAAKQAAVAEEGVGAARLKETLAGRQLEAAQKQVEAAEAARARAQVAVDECKLVAPHRGEVSRRNIEPGEVAQPGGPLLTLVDIREAKATFYVPNAELEAAKPGRKVQVVADAMPERSFEGVIHRVATEAEFTPRNVQTREDRDRLVYAVVVHIPNPDGALRPGMPVEITIPGTERQ